MKERSQELQNTASVFCIVPEPLMKLLLRWCRVPPAGHQSVATATNCLSLNNTTRLIPSIKPHLPANEAA
jgi:hypothetical protein